MKGKNPTRQQKKIMQERRLNPNNWLVLKNPTSELHIQHRESKKIKILSIQVYYMENKMIKWINNYIDKKMKEGTKFINKINIKEKSRY